MTRAWLTARVRTMTPGRSACLGAGVVGILATIAAAAVQDVDFTISNGAVIPQEPYATRIAVAGAAIRAGATGYHIPVTVQVQFTDASGTTTTIEPFGPFGAPLDGNVNPDAVGSTLEMPVVYDVMGVNPADMKITVSARCWVKTAGNDGDQNSEWVVFRMRNSAADPVMVKVLRHGDPVPPIQGIFGQSSAKAFLLAYIDEATDTVKLGPSDAIYLFELGAANLTDGSYDLQDAVVVVTLATTPMGLAVPTD